MLQLLRQRIEVHGIGCLAVKRRVWSAGVVELEVTRQSLPGVGHSVVSVQVDLLVLDALPESSTKTLSRQPPWPMTAAREIKPRFMGM